MSEKLTPDQKGQASLALGDVIDQTRDNFPDPRFRPILRATIGMYRLTTFNVYPYEEDTGSPDGIGTKPELAERLSIANSDPKYFEGLYFDTLAMVESDAARFGKIVLGIVNIVDVNQASPDMISALARGAKRACDEGKFALLNGETAELGYRTSGYGDKRVNLNAVARSLVVMDKLITGEHLTPGQPIVALREKSIRSNGLTKARAILEAKYCESFGYKDKTDYLIAKLYLHFWKENVLKMRDRHEGIRKPITNKIIDALEDIFGHPVLEQILVPWHKIYPEVTEQLLTPSTLYGRLINGAQGWIEGKKLVDITGAIHVSGGGVPEKTRRLLEDKNLGAEIEAVFPDPEGVQSLLKINESFSEENRLVNDKSACLQWNRGIGFMVITKDRDNAKRFVDLANNLGYEAAIVGKVIDERVIKFRGHSWNY